MTVEEQISAQLAAEYAELNGAVTPPAAPVAPVVIPPVVEPIVPVTPPAEPVIVTPVNVVEPPIVDVPKVRSFDEEFADRFKGKTVADIEAALTPKEVFANEKIKHLNDLAAKGIDVTSKEFLELQSLDIDKADTLFEQWKRTDAGKGLSDATIKHEINKKYNVDEWASKEDSELTLDDRANKEKMLRDMNFSKEWLISKKNESALEKQIDPAVSAALARDIEASQSNWEKVVDSDLVNKITKLSSPISYKDETGKVVESQFNLEVSEQDRKEVGEIMKQLTKDQNAFFKQFQDEKGNQRHDSLFTMMLKAKNYDKAVALANSEGAEKRALAIEKESKNTNFVPSESKSLEKPVLTVVDAQKEAIKNMNMK